MQPQTRHKLHNLFHSAVLVVGMAAIVSACAWTLWGGNGVLWASVGVVLAALLTPNISPSLVLRFYGARPLETDEFPQGYALLHELAGRAGLKYPPQLYYAPSALLSVFTVGGPKAAAITLTDGVLRTLNAREMTGVLAHELSHVASNDLRIMHLADVMGRAAGMFSYVGLFLLLLNLPLIAAGRATAPWLLVALLVFAPTLISLLQLALSRTREFDADLGAVRLTGDPAGLAQALLKLERYQGRLWEDIMLPGRRIPEPSLLRTHPPTQERVRRLMELEQSNKPHTGPWDRFPLSDSIRPVDRPPRWRRSGFWY